MFSRFRVYHSSSYFPSGNFCECSIRDISTCLRIFCHKNHRSWLDYCTIIENILDSSPNPSSKFPPETLFTGKEAPPLFQGVPEGIPVPNAQEIDKFKLAFDRLVKRAELRKSRPKRHKHKWNPQINDKVLVKDKKLSSLLKGRYSRMELLYRGPYRVSKILGDHTYEVLSSESGKLIGRFHKQLLRPFKE